MKISIRAARANKGLSQTKAGNLIGVNVGTISSWELGKTKPSYEHLKKISSVYEIPISNLEV